MAAMSVQGLTKRFGDVLAVDQLTFQVDPGTVPASSVPTAPGRRPPCGCSSAWSARPPARPPSAAGRTPSCPTRPAWSGRCWRRAASTPAARPATTSASWPRGRLDPRRVDEVLELVGLAAAGRRRAGGYSLGMRQRLGLAAALLGDPEVLLLDEPANGLDPEGVHWLRGLVRGLADQGRTVLVSSHVLAEVAQTVDQVVIIDGAAAR